jgi:hypothetical protein
MTAPTSVGVCRGVGNRAGAGFSGQNRPHPIPGRTWPSIKNACLARSQNGGTRSGKLIGSFGKEPPLPRPAPPYSPLPSSGTFFSRQPASLRSINRRWPRPLTPQSKKCWRGDQTRRDHVRIVSPRRCLAASRERSRFAEATGGECRAFTLEHC